MILARIVIFGFDFPRCHPEPVEGSVSFVNIDASTGSA